METGFFSSSGDPTPDPEYTGRTLVLFADAAIPSAPGMLNTIAGLTMATASEEEGLDALGSDQDGLMLERLGVAVLQGDPDQLQAVAVAGSDSPGILAVEPERVLYALPARVEAHSKAFLDGYYCGVRNLRSDLLNGGDATLNVDIEPSAVFDEAAATWGLQITNVLQSPFTGRGVRLAVLDTGLDLEHPDFDSRIVETRSFIPGETVHDLHGHGTHCIGTACGTTSGSIRPRYGIASEVSIFAGKVLSNTGRGSDGGILSGIEWALSRGCDVISMSLGARPGPAHSTIFEAAARRALQQGTLIVAAAGNESRRHLGVRSPVAHPANCPSIFAVAALDRHRRIADFSNEGDDSPGGQVDIAAPGVDVHSSWPMTTRYKRISGTSMATPHVAGIAALFAEAFPTQRGAALWALLQQRALRLPLPSTEVGIGLVQAP